MPLKRAVIIGMGRFLEERVKPLLSESGLSVIVFPPEKSSIGRIPQPIEECLLVLSSSFLSYLEEESPFELLSKAGGFIICADEPEDSTLRGKQTISPTSSDEEISSLIRGILYEGENTRKSPRLWTSIPVEYEVKGIIKVSEISSLSYFGAFIRTVSPPERGERVKVRFSIGSQKIEAEGPVLYSTRVSPSGMIVSGPEGKERKVISFPGFAVYFEKIDERSARLIRKYVDEG